MINWYIRAKKSDDSKVKELLAQYEQLDMSEKQAREDLKAKIKEVLPPEEEVKETPVEPDIEIVTPKEEVKSNFKYTEEDIKSTVDINKLEEIYQESVKEADKIQKARKKYETPSEAKDIEVKIWSIVRIGHQARNKIRAITSEIRKLEKQKSPLSNLAIKRNMFITDYQKGISITNIVLNHKADFSKEDLLIIINDDVINKITRDSDRYFAEVWERWKKKFLDSKTA